MGPAVINCLFVLFIAESPRWLYSRGRRDEAIRILAKYHSKNGDPDSPVVKLEIQEIETSISLTGGDKQFWNFKKVFDSPSNRYRFGLCAMISCWGQLAGNGMITCGYRSLRRVAGSSFRLLACPTRDCGHHRPEQAASAQFGQQYHLYDRRFDG